MHVAPFLGLLVAVGMAVTCHRRTDPNVRNERIRLLPQGYLEDVLTRLPLQKASALTELPPHSWVPAGKM